MRADRGVSRANDGRRRVRPFKSCTIPAAQCCADLIGSAVELQDQLIWIRGKADRVVRKNEFPELGVEIGSVGLYGCLPTPRRFRIRVRDKRRLRQPLAAWPEPGEGVLAFRRDCHPA